MRQGRQYYQQQGQSNQRGWGYNARNSFGNGSGRSRGGSFRGQQDADGYRQQERQAAYDRPSSLKWKNNGGRMSQQTSHGVGPGFAGQQTEGSYVRQYDPYSAGPTASYNTTHQQQEKGNTRKSRWGNKEPEKQKRRSRSRDRRSRSRGRSKSGDDKHSIFAELLGSRAGGEQVEREPYREEEDTTMQQSTVSVDEKQRQKRVRMRGKMDKLCSDVFLKGDNAPPPIKAFSDEPLIPQVVLDNLRKEQYCSPTPVQMYSIPVLCQKSDCMCCATTGSGKTLAFLIPLISNLLNEAEVFRPFFPGKNACALPLIVILAPTRDLSIQIDEQVFQMTKDTWISSFAIFGGNTFAEQSEQVGKRQIDILSATPGRLLDMVDRCKISFSFVKCIAFDEADNMLDLGFEKAIKEIMLKRDMPKKENRQMVMFSATFPKKIQKLAEQFLKKSFIFIRLGEAGKTTKCITQRIKYVDEVDKKTILIRDLMENQCKVIVFVSRRQRTMKVTNWLMNKGLAAGFLHGNLEQDLRQETIMKFKDDAYRILVATDVAGRGLDFPDVELVINYDLPTDKNPKKCLDIYTHRIGRTGRIGSKGLAISYFTTDNGGMAHKLAEYLRDSSQSVPDWMSKVKRSFGRRRNSSGAGQGSHRSANGKFISRPGDWLCSNQSCRNVNFAHRDKCNICKKRRSLV